MHRLKVGSTPLCDCGHSPQTPEHVLMSCPLTKEEHMAHRDNTGGETMGNKGGTSLHSFLHRRDLYQSLGFGHEENDR